MMMKQLPLDVLDLPPIPQRVANAVLRKIECGDNYDAQQLVKTFANRYKGKGEVAVALAICKEFAFQFASKGHGALSLDLASAALQCMQQRELPPSDAQLELVAELLESATRTSHGRPSAKDINSYVSKAVKWSRNQEHPIGCLRLHTAAATASWQMENYGLCQGHLVYCGDAETLGRLMEAWVPKGYPNERGFFWLRLVLMLLCLGRVGPATELLHKHSGVDWESEGVPSPLQVAYLLTAACKAKSFASFDLILRRYNLLMRRDPFLGRCAEQIRGEVFGVRPRQPASLATLFSSLFSTCTAAHEAT